MKSVQTNQIEEAVTVMHSGGVIAYPTEFCFGLGCDPRNREAVQRILKIKERQESQGLILVAAEESHVLTYADLNNLARYSQISISWPGPVTWILPKLDTTPSWVCGDHASVAMRVSAHPIVQALCTEFSGAIVSTSANRHGERALVDAQDVIDEMSSEVDLVVDGEVRDTDSGQSASKIFDALSGEQLR